jgi:chaperonin GroEL
LSRHDAGWSGTEVPSGHELGSFDGHIALNAGEDGSVVVGKILDKEQYNYGLDARSGEYGNLVTKGIIDPTKVVRAALQGAASVAGLLITTEAMVAEVPRKQAAAPAMPGGGMDF